MKWRLWLLTVISYDTSQVITFVLCLVFELFQEFPEWNTILAEMTSFPFQFYWKGKEITFIILS